MSSVALDRRATRLSVLVSLRTRWLCFALTVCCAANLVVSGQIQPPPPTQAPLVVALGAANLTADGGRKASNLHLDELINAPDEFEELHNNHPGKNQNKDSLLWSLVNVDKKENKSKLAVHVPMFFDMSNQNDQESGRSKLDLSVLQGLVTVSKDKVRDQQSGLLNGPLKVTVLGIPVYTSKGQSGAPPAIEQLRARVEKALSNIGKLQTSPRPLVVVAAPAATTTTERPARSSAAPAVDLSDQVSKTLQRTNEKVMRSLSDIFDRLGKILTSKSTNSRPATVASGATPMTTSRPRSDDKPTNLTWSTALARDSSESRLHWSPHSAETEIVYA